jgi:hypothetical protein
LHPRRKEKKWERRREKGRTGVQTTGSQREVCSDPATWRSARC